MKKILVSMFLLIFGLCLAGCVDTPNGPGSEQPVGEYDNNKLYSMYPLFVSQNQYSSKFEINHTFEDGIFSTVEDLEDIECESLSSLFDCNYSDEYLKENFVALYFTREESIWNESLCNVKYYDLFIENGQIYVTKSFDDYENMGDDVIAYFSELILIPKEWQQKLTLTSNFEINYNIEFNNVDIPNKYIMRYSKMQEFKTAYRKQILDQKYDDQMYREVYMLDVYGEYNDCLVSTVTYDGYVHTDKDWMITGSYGGINVTYSGYYPIYVCYQSQLYTLKEAFDNGYLSLSDIRKISNKINHGTDYYNIVKLNTEVIYGPYYSMGQEFEAFLTEFNLFNTRYLIIDNPEEFINLYTNIPFRDVEINSTESLNNYFKNNVIVVNLRYISGTEALVPVEYYYLDKPSIKISFVNDIDGDLPDVFLGYCIDIIEIPKVFYDTLTANN